MAMLQRDSRGLSNWLLCWKQNAQRKTRLFCFPFAGGGAFHYRAWAESLVPEIDLCAIQLPGRENRLREQPLIKMQPLVSHIARAIDPLLDLPFAFFGHSLGGLIAFELCRELRRQNKPLPSHLFVSAIAAPQLPNEKPLFHHQPDQQLLSEIDRLGGTPKEILRDADLCAMLLRILRADFTLLETHSYVAENPLGCSITAFGSEQDNRTSLDELAHWKEQTTKSFRLQTFAGGHFFLKTQDGKNRLLQEISDTLREEEAVMMANGGGSR